MIHITDEEFQKLAEFIEEHSGIHLKSEKKTLLVGRLNNSLSELGISTFTQYYNMLMKDYEGIELSRLIDKITTNHTYFMREAEHFKHFSEIVLPYLKETIKDHDIRMWCAASSSGEEPYTLAMIIDEFFKSDIIKWDKRLLATDLSLSILAEAQKGNYNSSKIESLPKIWLLNYFDKEKDGTYTIKASLKKEVVFRRFNLLEPVFPFKKKFHTIFCRNVMIYFDTDTKEKLINKLYNSLEYGGYLFIGHSETINRDKSQFKYIKPAIYRKI